MFAKIDEKRRFFRLLRKLEFQIHKEKSGKIEIWPNNEFQLKNDISSGEKDFFVIIISTQQKIDEGQSEFKLFKKNYLNLPETPVKEFNCWRELIWHITWSYINNDMKLKCFGL